MPITSLDQSLCTALYCFWTKMYVLQFSEKFLICLKPFARGPQTRNTNGHTHTRTHTHTHSHTHARTHARLPARTHARAHTHNAKLAVKMAVKITLC